MRRSISSGDLLGSFEQLVVLAVARLGNDAYGMTVRQELEERTDRTVSLGAVYATLDRLENKGYVTSTKRKAGAERQGRAKRIFSVKPSGLAALRKTLECVERMRDGLPETRGGHVMNRHRECKERDGHDEGLWIRLLEFAVHLLVPERVREEFMGDLLEEWSSCVVPRFGKLTAFGWLCSQLLRSVIPMGRVWTRGLFLGDNAMFQRQNVPKSVKMVTAGFLLMTIVNVYYFFLFLFTAPYLALPTLVEALLFIALAVGLLNLNERWRTSSLIITGLGVLVFPFCLLAFVFSSGFFLMVSEPARIDSTRYLLDSGNPKM